MTADITVLATGGMGVLTRRRRMSSSRLVGTRGVTAALVAVAVTAAALLLLLLLLVVVVVVVLLLVLAGTVGRVVATLVATPAPRGHHVATVLVPTVGATLSPPHSSPCLSPLCPTLWRHTRHHY